MKKNVTNVRRNWSKVTAKGKAEKAKRKRFFETLLSALRPRSFEIATYGTFAACESVKPSQGFSLKCLHVEGAGELRLPLSAQDTVKLRSVCEQAPFGKGLSTVEDTNVSRCWQVNASKVSFPGAPTFLSDTIQTLAMKAVCALGLNGAELQWEAHFVKLLFNEAGGPFTFHADSEKETGMFGSFILQLPTEEGYTGGKFVVKHKNRAQEFDCHLVSAIGFCYTAFFADCLHKLRKVESGTRVCLAFDLVNRSPLEPIHRVVSDRLERVELVLEPWWKVESGTAMCLAFDYVKRSPLEPIHKVVSDRLERVELVLEPWLKEAAAKRPNVCQRFPCGKLAIPLQHKYTSQNLSFAGLKGNDIIVTDLMKGCRDKNNNQSLDLHLCVVTKYELRDVQYNGYRSLEKVETERFEFGNWIGLDDKPVALKDLRLDVEKEVVCGEDELFAYEPDQEDSEALDNGHVTLRSYYRRALLVAWPKAHSVAIAWGGSVPRALDILENSVNTDDPDFCEQLHHIVLHCQQNSSKVWEDDINSNKDSVTPQLLSLCTRVSMSEDVLQILQLLAEPLEYLDDKKIGVRSAEVVEAIASAVQVFGWELVSWPIINLAIECGSTQGESFAHLASELVCIGNTDAGVLLAKAAINALQPRIAELESHKRPEFSWCQPLALLRSYPDVEKFLRGPQRKHHRRLGSLAEARSLCEKYFKSDGWNASGGYSATSKAEERSGGVYCVIQKTRHHFDVSLDHWLYERNTIERLRLEVGKLVSAVPETNSAALPASQRDSKRRRFSSGFAEDTVERAKSSKVEFIDLTFSE